MTKQEQFLYIVQTTILANAAYLTSNKDLAQKYVDGYFASRVQIIADEAIRASELIPQQMSANEAAGEFLGYMLPNLKDQETPSPDLPSWFARH